MDYGEILRKLGYKLVNRGNYWQTSALYRGGTNPAALSIFKNSGVWTDFVVGTKSYPFEALLKKTLKTNDLSQFNLDKIEPRKEKELLKEETIYPEDSLGRLLKDYSFYHNRNITTDTLKKFECGLATNGKLYDRIVFPIRNKDGKIHGFSGRKVYGDAIKWLHYGKSNNWFYPFYNIQECAEAIEETGKIIVVESIGDAMACFDDGVKNVIVAFSNNITPKLIARLSVFSSDIVIALNGDTRGISGCVNSFLKLYKIKDFVNIWYMPPREGDFGDMRKNGESISDYFNIDYSPQNHEAQINRFLTDIDKSKVSKYLQKSIVQIEEEYEFTYE